MSRTWLKSMKEIFNSLCDLFFLPGDFVTSSLAPRLEIIDNSSQFLLSISMSTLLWLLLLVGIWQIAGTSRRLIWLARVAVKANYFLLKTKLARFFTPPEPTGNTDQEIEVDLNDLDLAVLGSAEALSQGFLLSAPDVAEKLRLRLTKVQSSLEKLAANMMIERALGSIDDYENYRLTPTGASFLTMLHRNEK